MADSRDLPDQVDVGAYCREVEAFLCRRNGGHLIRLVGPAFVLVSGWAARGVPLRVVLHGVERGVVRLEARGPRRRPVRVEFCEADVMDAFDQWRRAVGPQAVGSSPGSQPGADAAADAHGKRQPSLTRHLERVIERLSSVRAATPMNDAAARAVDQALTSLNESAVHARGARGEQRERVRQQLPEIDDALLTALVDAQAPQVREQLLQRASDELRPLRPRLSDEAYADARARMLRHLLRLQLSLPEISQP